MAEKQKMLEPYSLQKEEEVHKYWKEKKIPEKVRGQNAKSARKYYFMDGPPYATGHIHMGTALNKILKDIAMRAARMRGFDVFDRPGYDTHGVPIEFQIEKEIGTKSRKDIEVFGIGKFVEKCREYATRHIDVMNSEFENLGVWMDWKNPYLTLSNDYIEAIWWTFKKAEEKGLLYLGKYPVHVCSRCETAVAYNEIEYTKQTDTSIYVKFKVKGENSKYLIVWTTTPWTLPGNTGVMVHPQYEYVEAELSNGETWIVAKGLVQKLMDAIEAAYAIKKEFKGIELKDLHYESPLEKNIKLNLDDAERKSAYRVIMSERYVNLEEGTGLVHTAPGHGKEDYEEGKKNELPMPSPVAINGWLTAEAGKYSGKKAREVDSEIISDLESGNALVYKHPYAHDYPICWRCKSPLLMLSLPQWFFRVSGIQRRMLELNSETVWKPEWMQDRMKNWIGQLSDWPVSRARYWGTPLPIWICNSCGKRTVIGSIEELEKLSGKKINNVHKPEIDNIEIKCGCGAGKKRVPEVLDVWFDSGVSSWAALGYPQSSSQFKKFWPADLNLEGTDQFRGWWNSQLILSAIAFDRAPYKTIAVHGMVLGMGKKKMSKSLGNIVQPSEVIEKYNRDYLRFYLASTSKGEDLIFDIEEFNELNRFFSILWNAFNFAEMYLQLKPEAAQKGKINLKGLQIEDRWLLSRLNSLADEVSGAYNSYDYPKACGAITNFVMEDLSRTYIRHIKERIGTKTQGAVENTTGIAIISLLKLLAPIAPHITEYLYLHLRRGKMPESVHLLEFPDSNKKLIDSELEKEFALAKDITQAALSLRESHKLKLRWPLMELAIKTKSGKGLSKVKQMLAVACNVKKVNEIKNEPEGNYASAQAGEITIYLNLDADEKLKEEWELRELLRRIQGKRKEMKLLPNQKVQLLIDCSDANFLRKYNNLIEKETNTKLKIVSSEQKEMLLQRLFYIAIV